MTFFAEKVETSGKEVFKLMAHGRQCKPHNTSVLSVIGTITLGATMAKRTPGDIIGSDALLQLIFEGYAVVPVKATDEMREEMARIADGPGRSYDEYWSMMVNFASGQKVETE